jgi:uncharacterized metal-binding protein YceD (DUF177 family)
MPNEKGIESAWLHPTSTIPDDGLAVERLASPAQLALLAEALGVVAVQNLRVSYRIDPMQRGRFRLSGMITARVTQPCVVTLDPVVSDIHEAVDVEFWPPGAVPVPDEAEQAILDAPEHEPIEAQRLAAGRVIAETLAAALPAFPRAPDAALEQREAGPTEGDAANPFAALAGWKPRGE